MDFIAGLWTGQEEDDARLIFSNVKYLPNVGPLLVQQSVHMPVGPYITPENRQDLMRQLALTYDLDTLAVHGFVERSEHEILIAHLFDGTQPAEDSLEAIAQTYKIGRPEYVQGSLPLRVVRSDRGIHFVARAHEPQSPRKDHLDLYAKHGKLRAMNAHYNRQQAGPNNPDVGLLNL